jgi:menaquinone-dependent protoporphyrinogen oxidase
MNRYLVIYMSHHGTTRKLAHHIAEKLSPAHVTLIDLKKDSLPALDSFDVILVGGSIHAGQLQSELRKFCHEHQPALLTRPLGLFLCFMNRGEGLREFEAAYPETLRRHAFAHGLFGGELLYEKMNFLERFFTKKISGHKESVSEIDYAAVEEFVRKAAAL